MRKPNRQDVAAGIDIMLGGRGDLDKQPAKDQRNAPLESTPSEGNRARRARRAAALKPVRQVKYVPKAGR